MKRLIGKLLIAGILSGGATFAAASPSSAARDLQCMDEAHWQQTAQAYSDAWVDASVILSDWQNADFYINPWTGQWTWSANVSGTFLRVYSYYDYITHVHEAQHDVNTAYALYSTFLDWVAVC